MATYSYDRERAVEYAVLWGITKNAKGANNSSQVRGLNLGAGSDCTNFASQVLAAGGLVQTTHWGYTPGHPGYIVTPNGSPWKYVPALLDFLTSQFVGGDHTPCDMTPSASYYQSGDNFLSSASPRKYSNFQSDISRFQVERGDLIFYVIPGKYTTSGLNIYDHVAVIIGWGCAQDGCEQTQAPSTLSGYEDEQREGLVPWIIDHGVAYNNKSLMGKARPYDQFYGAYHHVMFGFTHLPDGPFDMLNVKAIS